MLERLHAICAKLNVLVNYENRFLTNVFAANYLCDGTSFLENFESDGSMFSNVLGVLNGMFAVLEQRDDGWWLFRLFPHYDNCGNICQFLVMEKLLNDQEKQEYIGKV